MHTAPLDKSHQVAVPSHKQSPGSLARWLIIYFNEQELPGGLYVINCSHM